MLDLAILGLLKEQPHHGYELKKQLAEVMGPLARVSFGSLYPALARLEAQGAVRAVEEAAAPAPPTPATGSLGAELAVFRKRHAAGRGARSARNRKVYEITEQGHALFDELLAGNNTPVDDERGFGLRLAFARYLAPDARLRLLERRRAHLVEQLARSSASAGAATRDSYRSSLLEHSNATTEADISWLDRLIAAERGAPS